MMADSGGGVQKNTAYGVFVQACWAQHKRQYPDELIHKVDIFIHFIEE